MYRAKGSSRPLRLALYNPGDQPAASPLTLRAAVPRAVATGAWELESLSYWWTRRTSQLGLPRLVGAAPAGVELHPVGGQVDVQA